MDVSFIKVSPTQNVTILVTGSVARDQQPGVAAQLLAYDGVGGEQVGFLEEPSLVGARMRLQMMGGEFCGNATMSLGAYLAWTENLADGACADYLLEVSGADSPVPCRIERRGNRYRGTVRMPIPERLGAVALDTDRGSLEMPVIHLPGISHVIAPVETGLTREEIARRIRDWNETIRADALGVLRWDEAAQTMEPIVYVPSTDSAVWERGCGSGTAALGCWKAMSEKGAFRASVRQPGGEIVVAAGVRDGRIENLTITGDVRITARGTAFLDTKGESQCCSTSSDTEIRFTIRTR